MCAVCCTIRVCLLGLLVGYLARPSDLAPDVIPVAGQVERGEGVALLPYTAEMYVGALRAMHERGSFEGRETIQPYESIA